MDTIRYAIGLDISTQTITAMLVGVAESGGAVSDLAISSAWTASRPCREVERKSPEVWVRLARECIEDLKTVSREAELAEGIGVSATFPAVFPILSDGRIDPGLVSLYDNTDDAGLCDPEHEDLLARAESETLNRMWPGNAAIGLAHLVRFRGLRLADTAAIVPGSSAFVHTLLRSAGRPAKPSAVQADFSQSAISGLYQVSSGDPVPPGVAALLQNAIPDLDTAYLRRLLPQTAPSWRNALPEDAAGGVRQLLGLTRLRAVSIGAGDSPLGVLALMSGPDTIINVRGSSDSPLMNVPYPRPRTGARETVLHYPLPSAATLADPPWSVIAPMLRSGRVWDWVKGLRYAPDDTAGDRELEAMALSGLKKRLRSRPGSPERVPVLFVPSLGGERAPEWNARATGAISGLLVGHGLGDIALAALEGMSATLARCLRMMEDRYDAHPRYLLLAGGPTRNRLWNWITAIFTGKRTFATTFSDASLLGAAMLGYATAHDGEEPDRAIRSRLLELSRIVSGHPLVKPAPVEPPDAECAALERDYAQQACEIKLALT